MNDAHDPQQPSDLLSQAYDPAFFAQANDLVGRELAAYLERAASEPAPSLVWKHPTERVAEADTWLDGDSAPGDLGQRVVALAQAFLGGTNRLHSPHYMGHQVPPSVPLAGLFDALGSVTNQPMAIYEMGPFSTGVEKAMQNRLAAYLDWPAGSFGAVCTHGGSLSNLTALLTARNVKYPDAWDRGVAALQTKSGRRPALLTSAESHYCVARAAGILGLGGDQVLKVGLDGKRRMCPAALRQTLAEAPQRGLEPFALVGSACATPIGAFDPLEELAAIASEHGLWFHVDGAHGASLLLSQKHRDKLAGIERADSITWDAHKMLFVPALATFLFYRDRQHAEATFRQDAPFLFDPEAPDLAEFDSGVRTVECTKRSMTLGLWGVWALFGPELFEQLIDRTIATARLFWELLTDASDFAPCHEPECNILCFRYVPAELTGVPPAVMSAFQQSLRRRIVESGEFYITSGRIDGVMAQRVTIIHPFTGRDHLERLMDALRVHGQRLLRERGLAA